MSIDTASYIEELHQTAREQTGLVDFGDPTYRERLSTVLQSYETDCHIGEEGWRYIRKSLMPYLIARLYTQHGWADHPDILSSPLQQPIVSPDLPAPALLPCTSSSRKIRSFRCWSSGLAADR